MAELTVKATGFAEFDKTLADFTPKFRNRIMRGGMQRAVAVFRAGMRQRVPKVTGALAKSIRSSTRVFVSTGVVVGTVRTGGVIKSGKLKGRAVWYGGIVEGGAKAHLIKPINGKALAFNGRAYASVKNPGFSGRLFAQRTATEDAGKANQAFEDYVGPRVKSLVETGSFEA